MPLPLWIVLWISLALLVLSVTLGAAYCFRAGLRLWRDVHSFTAALAEVVVALTDSLAATAQRGAGAPRLDAAMARLHASWRRWSVLAAAVQDVRSSLTAVYPRK